MSKPRRLDVCTSGPPCSTILRACALPELQSINVDLIAGLPHQTGESWEFSLAEAIASDVPHVSVYMLEVDDDSRLGREVMAGGTRYHAHFVPDEELDRGYVRDGVRSTERCRASDSTRYQTSPGMDTSRATISSIGRASPILGSGWTPTPCCIARDLRTKPCVLLRRTRSKSTLLAGHTTERQSRSSQPRWRKLSFWDLRLNRGRGSEKSRSGLRRSRRSRHSQTRFQNVWNWACWNATAT